MKVYKLTVKVLDIDDDGADYVRSSIENASTYLGFDPEIVQFEEREIAYYSQHPIVAANDAKRIAAFKDLFGPPVDSVSVSKQRLAELVSAEAKLIRLEDAGLDCVEGSDEALAGFEGTRPDELVITDGYWAG